jgi:hypothetical protein
MIFVGRLMAHPLRPAAILCLLVPLEFAELGDFFIRKPPYMHSLNRQKPALGYICPEFTTIKRRVVAMGTLDSDEMQTL